MSLGDMIFTVRAGANVGRFYRRPGYLFGYPVRRPDNCYRHHRNRGDQKGGIAGTATSQTFSPTTLTRSSLSTRCATYCAAYPGGVPDAELLSATVRSLTCENSGRADRI
jgi:hypothetical protein